MANPFLVLGVTPQSSSSEIRAAYLEAVRKNPPERNEKRFQVIRRAYECIEDEEKRYRYLLFSRELPDAMDIVQPLSGSDMVKRPSFDVLRMVLGSGD